MKKSFLFLTLLLIIIAFAWLGSRSSCSLLHRHSLPETVVATAESEGASHIGFLYQPDRCDTCPNQDALDSVGEEDIIFYVPMGTATPVIGSIKEKLGLYGQSYYGEADVEVFLERLSHCLKRKDWPMNVLVTLDDEGRLDSYQLL